MNQVQGAVTLGLLTILLGGMVAVSAPAGAVQVELSTTDDAVTQGENISVTTDVVLRPGESVPIDWIELHLIGEQIAATSFNIDGEIQSEQAWIANIERVRNTTSYGITSSRYGYDEETDENVSFGSGRGYGDNTGSGLATLQYEITINTNALEIGTYEARTVLVASSNVTTHEYSSTTKTFEISAPRQETPAVTPSPEQSQTPTNQTQSEAGQNESDTPTGNSSSQGTVVAEEQLGFEPLDVMIIFGVVVITFSAGYFAMGPVVINWYRGFK